MQLAIGEVTATPLANSFLGMCSEEAKLEGAEDRKIARTLKQNVMDEVNRRNDIAHGDWRPGVTEGSPTLRPPTLVRLRPGRGNFPARRPWRGVEEELADPTVLTAARIVHSYAVEDLNALSDSVLELTRLTAEFGSICMAERRPGQPVQFVPNSRSTRSA